MKTINELFALINATDNDLEKAVLINNYNAVLYNDDVIDTVINEFNNYAGKKIGEATMKKINAALSAAFPGLRAYIAKEYDNSRKYIYVSRDVENQDISKYEDNIHICWKYHHHKDVNLFDDDSNLIKLEKEFLQFVNKRKYIDDVQKYIELKTDQFNALKALEEDYNKLCDLFDADKVKGLQQFRRIYTSRYITN